LRGLLLLLLEVIKTSASFVNMTMHPDTNTIKKL